MSDRFAPFAARMRAAELPELAIRTFRHYYEKLVAGDPGTLAESAIEPVPTVPAATDLGGFAARGRDALACSVVIKLNGGLGTSMGMTRAKSLLPVKDGCSFLDVIALQLQTLQKSAAVSVPLVLMDSFRTRDDSLAALARHPDLAGSLPRDFLQHKVPRIRADDLTPVSWPAEPDYEWCPPGHGDLYTALLTSGMLDELREAGVRHAFVSNADNLGATLDPEILGWFVASGAPFVMEVCARTPADRKGGHIARQRDGGLVLREIAQCPEADLGHFQDITRHRFFNTNSLWIDLDALARELERRDGLLGLPMIRNEKSVDPRDPDSPRVIQLETAMGAAISVFSEARALQVDATRFRPVKTSNDLLAIRSDAYRLDEHHHIRVDPRRESEGLLVDLDPRWYRSVDDLALRFPAGPPSLVGCRRFEVRGDVRFGAGVVCQGDVVIHHDAPTPRQVPDGTVLDDAG